MDDITRQLHDIRIQEQELHERATQLKRQRLLLQKQQYEEEIKRIDAELEEPVSDIDRLSMLLTEQQHHIEDLEKNPRSVKSKVTKIAKQPPNQRTKVVRRTRIITPPEPITPPKQETVIDFGTPVSDDMQDVFYTELISDDWVNDDDEQRRITQLMYGELSPADTEKINGSDKLYNDYINGVFTPSSYVPLKPSEHRGHQAAIADHLRRRAKGTRWRPHDAEPPPVQPQTQIKLPLVASDDEVEFINQLDHLANKAGHDKHIFRHTRIE